MRGQGFRPPRLTSLHLLLTKSRRDFEKTPWTVNLLSRLLVWNKQSMNAPIIKRSTWWFFFGQELSQITLLIYCAGS